MMTRWGQYRVYRYPSPSHTTTGAVILIKRMPAPVVFRLPSPRRPCPTVAHAELKRKDLSLEFDVSELTKDGLTHQRG